MSTITIQRQGHLAIRIEHSPVVASGPALSPVPPRRLVAVFVVTQTFGFVGLMGVFPILLGPMADDLGHSRTALAVATTISTLAGTLAGFPVGRLLDRGNGRLTMTAGAALGVLGVLLWARADGLPGLYAAFVVIGISQAMSMYEAAFAVIVAATDRAGRQRAILTMTMIVGLTTYLASPLMGWLEVRLGWRGALVVLAVAMLVTMVPGHLWAIPTRTTYQARAELRTGMALRQAVGSRDFWLLTVSFTAQAASMAAVLTMLVTYLRDIGHTAMAATSIPVAIGVLQIAARFALTAVGHRVTVAVVCVGAFLAQGAGMMLLPLVGLSVTLSVACVAAVGLGNGIGVIARPVVVADSFGTTEFATIMAVLAIPMALARASCPLLATWIGDGRFLVVFGAVSMLAAVVLVPVARRARKGPAYA